MRYALLVLTLVIASICEAQVPALRNLKDHPMYELENGVVYLADEVIPKSDYDKVYRLKVGGMSNPIQSLQDAGLPLLVFPNLVELDLSYNHFYHFPKGLGELRTLKRLNLERLCAHDACESSLYSKFEFPENFFQLEELRELRISFLDQSNRNELKRRLPGCDVWVAD